MVAFAVAVATETVGQQPEGQRDRKVVQEKQQKLLDPGVTTEVARFNNGSEEIQAFLARPKKPERSGALVIVPGDFGLTEYTRVTAVELAQAGFVALGVDLFSRASKVKNLEDARRVYFDVMTDALTLQDLQAAIDYLKRQAFVNSTGVGLLGFRVGGRYSLLLAALSRDVAASVAFYGPLQL
jgi:carboxymethylenebutenolidase